MVKNISETGSEKECPTFVADDYTRLVKCQLAIDVLMSGFGGSSLGAKLMNAVEWLSEVAVDEFMTDFEKLTEVLNAAELKNRVKYGYDHEKKYQELSLVCVQLVIQNLRRINLSHDMKPATTSDN
ncbi:hypothetical protein HELRODRAFT_181215 [Helobdella robusta]|uniref:Uncharacterized protein n=1 Tax=Helobdella robusta TaxID=6412 RepID=T1FGR3_HELRO|nr:hypothetical protein HELRODRAFT_181215 [Helobdella robusta]ESN93120.1 hypothetical protein HELRODRAFT_181215 [Helobdella robusta]